MIFLAFVILGLVALLRAIQTYTAVNYSDPHDPYFAGNFAVEIAEPVVPLTIVSYNIWFGKDIDQALLEMKEIQLQNEMDIVLLQEMDEVGTARIARELKMNYVYFPAAIEPTYNKNFGNAILSRWPILEAKKLVLPHKSLSNRMNRTATKATVQIPGGEILVYNLHTESIFTLPWYRKEQYMAVLNDIDPEAEFVIVGGDFNSFTEPAVDALEEDYKQARLERVSRSSGATLSKFGVELPSDHIFARGFVLQETGKLAGATASDHLPIWVTLIPE